MASQKELDSVYMGTALLHAKLSYAKRKKVGVCLVTKQAVCLTGYNGQPSGFPNECEELVDGELVTKSTTVHAELNAVLKAAKEGVSLLGSTLYTTLSCCEPCSAMLVQAGVSRVVYLESYRSTKGVELLQQAGILVEQINLED